MPSRRDTLAQLKPGAAQHAGLWFDKYINIASQEADREQPKTRLVQETAAIPEPEGYALFYQRWERAIREVEGAQTRYAQTVGRLAIGLGAESVVETSIALHRTYGVPYIPGSALKGLAAAYAHQWLDDERWRKGAAAHRVMFGDTTRAGYVTFFDALYVPGSGHERRPLWPDVLTVHHPDYYQQSGAALRPPADWDSPNPVPFLTATGRYLLAVAGPPAWRTAALDILAEALREIGIGAKTSSGYGRMAIVATAGQVSAPPTRQAAFTPLVDQQVVDEGIPPAPPSPTGPHLPAVGEVFTGKILEIEEGNVFVEVPRFAPGKALGVIRANQVGGRKYREGNTARVEVVAMRETRSGRVVLELKPAPRQE
jgi:CRISPR-associated protein Cmr6